MKSLRTGALTVICLTLSTAGCALRSSPTPAPWAPGTYHYRSNVPGAGPVAGIIEVGAEGPLSLTSSLGPCRDPEPDQYKPWHRTRIFVCGTDYRVNVVLGRSGGPPIEGGVSNRRTVTNTYAADTTCRKYETTATGEQICILWNQGMQTERETTGAGADFWLVPDSLAPRP